MEKIEAQLIESFKLINHILKKHHIRYCLIGGIAAGYWGQPRYTHDMDFTVVSLDHNLSGLTKILQQEGCKVLSKGDKIQVTGKGKLHFIADFILAEMNYQDWVIQRAKPVTMFDIDVPICSAEDLIILKLIANRRQDLLDIENILKYQKDTVDKEYLQKWFNEWELTDRFKKEFGKL